MAVEQHGPLPSSNYTAGRFDPVDGSAVHLDSIVLHTMVGWISSADARFHNPAAQVSAHFGVRIDGSLWQWVDTWNTAYHAGLYYENLRSIGIECEDEGNYNSPRPDALYTRAAQLVAQLCRENNIPCVRGTGGPGIYDHRDVVKVFGSGTATACPDSLDTNRIIREAQALLTPPPPPVDATILRAIPAVSDKKEWATLYALEAPKAGLRPEIALAQALKETNRFLFTGDVPASYNNPAGLGATGGAGVGNKFPTKHDGVVAHLQHLLLYYTAAHIAYCTPTIDQRHWTHKGYPNDVHQFDGHWAVPGTGYGDSVLALVPEALALLS